MQGVDCGDEASGVGHLGPPEGARVIAGGGVALVYQIVRELASLYGWPGLLARALLVVVAGVALYVLLGQSAVLVPPLGFAP